VSGRGSQEKGQMNPWGGIKLRVRLKHFVCLPSGYEIRESVNNKDKSRWQGYRRRLDVFNGVRYWFGARIIILVSASESAYVMQILLIPQILYVF
jgi:hypothetical protein